MLYLKCTQDVYKHLGLRKQDLAVAEPTPAPLGNWYIHRFLLGRRQAYIFMSDTTLLSFILFGGKKRVTAATMPHMLLGGLAQLLTFKGYPESAVTAAFKYYTAGRFAATDSRVHLGVLNNLVSHYQWSVAYDGGLDQCDLTNIIMRINTMPQRSIAFKNAWDATRHKLG